MKPHPKVTAASLGAAISIIATWILNTYTPIKTPDAVNLAFTTLCTFGCGWFCPSD